MKVVNALSRASFDRVTRPQDGLKGKSQAAERTSDRLAITSVSATRTKPASTRPARRVVGAAGLPAL